MLVKKKIGQQALSFNCSISILLGHVCPHFPRLLFYPTLYKKKETWLAWLATQRPSHNHPYYQKPNKKRKKKKTKKKSIAAMLQWEKY